MRWAPANVPDVVPGRKRNMSSTVREFGAVESISFQPTLDSKPSTWPSSCWTTESKSVLLASTPFDGSKSKSNFELNPIDGGSPKFDCSPPGSATGLIRPSARRFALPKVM